MDNNICAPKRFDDVNNTCFSTDQLYEMAKAYNRYITKNRLKPNRIAATDQADLINIKKDKKHLLTELLTKFNNVCNSDQYCLTQQSFMNEVVQEMRDEIDNNTFRTKGPKDANEWLSTLDINNIMKQYEKIYTNFKFLGAVPLNCDEYSFCSLYNIDFNKCHEKKIRYLGIIFNLDRHGQPGSHWVSMFIDLDGGEINFCDSNGKPPIDNMLTIINKFKDYYKSKTGKDIIYKYNTKSYQKDSSECGIYSCNFIIRRLSGESFEDVTNNSLGFKEINSCRNIYFRNKPSNYKAHILCDPK